MDLRALTAIAIVTVLRYGHCRSCKEVQMRREFDLQVGDMLQIGPHCVIVVETQDGEVTLKICHADDLDDSSSEWVPAPAKK